MSDTNSKGGKKDTDKIQFIKVGTRGSVSEVYPADKDKKKDPSSEPLNNEPSIQVPEPVFVLDENDSGFTSEMQIEREEEARSSVIHDLKEQIESLTNSSKKENLSTDQSELLRKYIELKETEVKDIRAQQKQYRNFVRKLSKEIEHATAKNKELLTTLEATKRREDSLRKEVQHLKEKMEQNQEVLKNDFEEQVRKFGDVKSESRQLQQRQEEWKEKVKEDLKRIKLKERELENKYELLKRDTQALLDSKDQHVLELKNKNDALELELEHFEERLRKVNSILGSIDGKKHRLLDTLKLVTSLLEQIDSGYADSDDERKAG